MQGQVGAVGPGGGQGGVHGAAGVYDQQVAGVQEIREVPEAGVDDAVVEALGEFTVPTDWDDFIARHQETVDTLVKEQDQEPLDVATLYDRRFEKAIAKAVEGS